MIQNHKNGFGPLKWYNGFTGYLRQDWRKWWAHGLKLPLIAEMNQIPPFQLAKGKTGTTIAEFKLIRLSDGTEYDVLSDLESLGGLTVSEFTGYDLVIYPAKITIPNGGALFGTGHYWCRMKIGPDYWCSELFCMRESVADLLKFEYCHGSNFNFENAHIYYAGGFKSFFYLDTVLSAPEYPTDKDLDNRQGHQFPERIISYKRYQFAFAAHEAAMDALRIAPLHDTKTVYFQGETFTVEDIEFNPEWEEEKDCLEITALFYADTVVFMPGRPATPGSCTGPTEGSCFSAIPAVTSPAVAMIVQGSAEYLGGYYVSEETGLNVPLEVEDGVIIRDPDNPIYEFYSWDGAAFVLEETSDGEAVYTYNEQKYWFDYGGSVGLKTTEITALDFDGGIVQGYGLPDTVIEVWLRNAEGGEWLAGIGTNSEIETPGISFAVNYDAVEVQLRSKNAVCGAFDNSEWFPLEGIGYWIIEDTFEVQ